MEDGPEKDPAPDWNQNVEDALWERYFHESEVDDASDDDKRDDIEVKDEKVGAGSESKFIVNMVGRCVVDVVVIAVAVVAGHDEQLSRSDGA